MTPDLERAAAEALRVLIDHAVSETPIVPLPLLLSYPNVRVISFTRMADEAGVERHDLVPLFGSNQDAATFHLKSEIEGVEYVVVYNMRLPFEIVWRALARELGHIVLGHDGQTRSLDVRMAEATCFAHHLICPRPVLRLLLDSGLPLTQDVLTDTVGCSSECVAGLQKIPAIRVPAELNTRVRDLFARGMSEYVRFHRAASLPDRSPVLDLGSYMGGYEE